MQQKRQISLFLLLSFFFATSAHAAVRLTVLYPEVPRPFNLVFEQIIEGIRQQYDGEVQLYSIAADTPVEQTLDWVRQQGGEVVIALGRRGYQVAQQLHQDKTVITGALPIQPNAISGISLLPDPAVMFSSLRALSPQSSRVAVVYHPSNKWLIDLATQRAQQFSIELLAIEVSNVKEAVNAYESLFGRLTAQHDALWLLVDPVASHEQLILPRVLKYAWSNNLVLFSSRPEHAKRGALFSMYPNNKELGQQLVIMGLEHHRLKSRPEVLPLDRMQVAVNLRTASHLGLMYSQQQRRDFDLIFQ